MTGAHGRETKHSTHTKNHKTQNQTTSQEIKNERNKRNQNLHRCA